jgi:hypothetical protein
LRAKVNYISCNIKYCTIVYFTHGNVQVFLQNRKK